MSNFKISKNNSLMDTIKIINCSKIISGGTPSTNNKEYWGNDLNWLTPVEIGKRKEKYIYESIKKISFNGAKFLKNKKIQKDDLIITTRGTVGNIAMISKDMFFNQSCESIRFNIEKINPHYGYYFFLKNKSLLTNNAIGGVFPAINKDFIGKIEISHPPLSQQSSIAEILSIQESIINEMETLVKKYETRLHYLSEELLSGKIRIKEANGKTVFYKNTEWKDVEINSDMKEIPVDWEVDKVCNFTNLIKGASIPENFTNYKGNGLMYLKTTEFWLDSASKRATSYAVSGYTQDQVKNKDEYVIGFGGFNKVVGKGTVGLVSCEGEGIVSANFFKIKNSEHYYFSVNCLKLYSSQKFIVNNAEGSIALTAGKYFKILEASIPSNHQEMQEISNQLEPMHYLISSQKELVEKEKKKFNFLLNNLLSGKYLVEENIIKE